MEKFRSRYSVIILATMVIPIGIVVYETIAKSNLNSLFALVFIGIILFFLLGIRYIISGDELIFKMWSIHWDTINIKSITKIERSYSPVASNAGSLKRIHFKFKKGKNNPFVLISPKNEIRFIQALKQINPEIEIEIYSKNKTSFYRFWVWDI